MKPVQFSECVAIGDVGPHVGTSSCWSVCDIPAETPRRCKTGLLLEPTLSPVSYRTSMVIYKDSSRRRYRSIVHYEPRLRSRVFQDTCYVLPRPPPQPTFASISLDAAAAKSAAANGRRWYTTSVQFDKTKDLACGGMVTLDGGFGARVSSRGGEEISCNGDGGEGTWKGSSHDNEGGLKKSHDGPQSTVIEVNVTPAITNPGDRIVIMTSDRNDAFVASDVNNNRGGDDDDELVSNSYLIRWPSTTESIAGGKGTPSGGLATYRTRIKIDSDRNFK